MKGAEVILVYMYLGFAIPNDKVMFVFGRVQNALKAVEFRNHFREEAISQLNAIEK